MKRSDKNPIAILTSDWHLREDTPVCRTDDFWKAQWDKVDFVADLQNEYSCVVIHAGDLFHHWKPSPHLLSKTIEHLPDMFYTVYGQHDLPQHNYELRHKSGINVLDKACPLFFVLEKGHWNDVIPGSLDAIGVWHKFVWDGKKLPWPGCQENTAKQVLQKYKEFDIIVTGDHHKSFVVENYEGRLLINPGCLTRQDASYINHKPKVFLYYEDARIVEPVPVPCERGSEVITREHIDIIKERDERLEAFISRLKTEWEVTLSFEENIKRALSNHKIPKKVKDIINKSIDN